MSRSGQTVPGQHVAAFPAEIFYQGFGPNFDSTAYLLPGMHKWTTLTQLPFPVLRRVLKATLA
jgi:hypothetical protein